jgi:uncharacterized membrane protein YoaK (UPF0700 family)
LIAVRHGDTRLWWWPSAIGAVLITELIPLGALLIFWRLAGPHPIQETICILVAFAASAMGIQSAAMLRLHGGPTTTYITGTLTTFATKLIEWLRLVDTASAPSRSRQDLTLMSHFSAIGAPWMYGSTWLVYLTGVVVGGLLFLGAKELALLLPMLAIVACIIVGIEGQGVAIEVNERSIAKAATQSAENRQRRPE